MLLTALLPGDQGEAEHGQSVGTLGNLERVEQRLGGAVVGLPSRRNAGNV